MSEAKWYVVHTYSGYENKVKANIDKTIENRHLEDQILEVRVPLEDVVEMKNGVQKVSQKKMFPGYVLIHMIMNDDTWYVVRNTPGVTGFIGSSGKGAKPTPLPPQEVDNVLKVMGMSRIDVDKELSIGTKVKIIGGPFTGMFGTIEEIDNDNQKFVLNVDLFGQETQVEVDFEQISKA